MGTVHAFDPKAGVPKLGDGTSDTVSAPLAREDNRPHTEVMTTPVTTDLLDAKLENIELKMDARVQRIEDKMDAFVQSSTATQESIKSLKTTIVVTGISSVLAIVLGVAAFNATVLSNMVASFESGKNTAQSLGQTQQELQKREQRLDSVEKKLDQLIAAPQKK